VVFLAAGLIIVRTEFLAARGLDRWITLGPVFIASPLAAFAGEHFVTAQGFSQMVPVWLPARVFWVFFVGCAWIAGATSLVVRKCMRLSAMLLGLMFLLIVTTIHIPNAISDPHNRVAWIVVLRETAFAGGVWALAGSLSRNFAVGMRNRTTDWRILFGRFSMAFAVIFFAVEHFLHPELAPGVPDSKVTPSWIPLHALWGYPVGAFLLIAGIALLVNKRPRMAAASIGVLMTLLTLFLYVPILAIMRDPAQMTEGINFVFDTLLFGGTALLVARGMPSD
jgi:uncharacterized membrane protein